MKHRGKKKKIKRNEDNLRDLWGNVKCPNIQIIGAPEEHKNKHAKTHINQTNKDQTQRENIKKHQGKSNKHTRGSP